MVTPPISQTPARSMENPPSPAPATPTSPAPDETHMETSPHCAMPSTMPPLVSPVPPSPSLPKSQTVTRSIEHYSIINFYKARTR